MSATEPAVKPEKSAASHPAAASVFASARYSVSRDRSSAAFSASHLAASLLARE